MLALRGRPAKRGPTGRQGEIGRLDKALYTAIALTPTPRLDKAMRELSRAADHSKLWSALAAVIAACGGRAGRRAAVNGMASIAAASILVNLVLKPIARRRRPDRRTALVPLARRVTVPGSRSFPSGHSASAFAFATAVGVTLPRSALPLNGLAALVAYSRVHTGVHYPSDVIAGSVIGAGLAPAMVAELDHFRAAPGQRRWSPKIQDAD